MLNKQAEYEAKNWQQFKVQGRLGKIEKEDSMLLGQLPEMYGCCAAYHIFQLFTNSDKIRISDNLYDVTFLWHFTVYDNLKFCHKLLFISNMLMLFAVLGKAVNSSLYQFPQLDKMSNRIAGEHFKSLLCDNCSYFWSNVAVYQ